MTDDETLPQRLARPGETFEYADGSGTLHTLTADDEGHVQPADGFEDAMLEQRGHPRIEAAPHGPKRVELQERAAGLDLPTTGTKAELTAAIAAREAELAGASPNDAPAGDDGGSSTPADGDNGEAD